MYCIVAADTARYYDELDREEAREKAIEEARPAHQARLLCDAGWLEIALNELPALTPTHGRDVLLALSIGDDATVRNAIKVIRAQLLERAWADSREPAEAEIEAAVADSLSWGDE